ncbi:MAG: DUF1064 domain-containing protein [Phycisphaerae bacterium]|nr:DUF1064 domain-containing protein [Phycisphaerae bacterium]
MTALRHKFNAQRTEYRGFTYDSKAEALRAMELDALQRGGHIAGWLRQVRIPLGPDFSTMIDFLVFAWDGDSPYPRAWCEEVKGVETPAFRKVRQLWPKYSALEMRIYKAARGKLHEAERLPARPRGVE